MSEQKINKLIADTFLDMAEMLETGKGKQIAVALTALGSEHGEELIYEAAKKAADAGVKVKLIGSKLLDYPGVDVSLVETTEEAHKKLEELVDSGEASGGVTMHYPFPIGVATVGRVIAPSTGRDLYIATTTGATATDPIESMIRNAVYGIVSAKACGVKNPTVGILNIAGAPQVESALMKLKEGGYEINFASSGRADGGALLRGNDVLTGSADVLVTDSLTGNVLTKMMSAYTTGGSYESVGYGYGPGLGEGFSKLILIVSRASGVPVVTNAMLYASQLVQGNHQEVFDEEMKRAKAAGLDDIIAGLKQRKQATTTEVSPPPTEVVTEEISGIDILEVEDAAKALWVEQIYASTGMGCTGPVVLVAEHNVKRALDILQKAEYLQ